MDEKMQEQYVEILKSLRESAEHGKDFVLEQAPLVAQEIVTCRAIESIAAMIGCVAGLLVCLGVLFYAIRSGALRRVLDADPEFPSDIPVVMCGGVFSVLGGVALLVGLSTNAVTFAKTQYAPRVVVLEEVGKMLK